MTQTMSPPPIDEGTLMDLLGRIVVDADEARIHDVVLAWGLTRFRRAAETPFNLVFEARP